MDKALLCVGETLKDMSYPVDNAVRISTLLPHFSIPGRIKLYLLQELLGMLPYKTPAKKLLSKFYEVQWRTAYKHCFIISFTII